MATTKAPPYPKQKYTDAKFRETLALLPLFEILKIEYLSKGVWFKMVSKRANSFNCECCGVENLGPTPIVDHVRGKKHRSALQNAERLFHPNYTTPKNSNAAARTPVLDALNSIVKPSKTIPTKVTAGTPKSAQQKPGPASIKQQGQQKAPVKKSEAANENSEATNNSKSGNAKKPDDPQAVPNNGEKNTPSEKSTVPNQSAQGNQNKTKPMQNENKEQSQENDNVSKPKGSAEGKQETNSQQTNKQTANIDTEKGETEKASTVDDDESDVIFVSDNLDEINRTNPVEKADMAISVINLEAPKPQRPQKNSAKNIQTFQRHIADEPKQHIPTITNETRNIQETSKKVLNPAAILAKSVERNENDNTPHYEQNRVIIPTIDKNKKKQQTDAVAQKKSPLPSFSTKTFSTEIKDDIEGIIGVEYVVKILKVYNDPEPFYECCLCEVVMDGIGMQTHLLGYNHRYKYIEKHFPTCFNQYKGHIGNIQVMGIILDRVAKAIESHHGRELPYECLSGEFRSNRHGVMTTVYSFRHASEYSGPSFTNVVDAKQVDEFYKKKNVYLPPKADPKRKPTFDTRNPGPAPKRNKVEPIPTRGGKRGGVRGNVGPPRRPYREEVETNTLDDAVHKQMVEEFLQNTCERSRSPGGHRRRHKSRSRSRSPHHLIYKRPQRRSPSPLRDGDVWQAYRHLVDRSKVELDEMYREYRRDPEKHPLYDEEWRKFWKQRKDEISREGLDHRNYDFQPEWVRFFAVRIEELYDDALENIKINSRQRLILPMTNDELEDKRYHVNVPEEDHTEIQVTKEIPQQNEPPKRMSVVHVLRLLTALEDYLGSLGPKVVDLLSKALLVEKSNPKDVNEIVLTLENCTILETAMEKLKGVLIAGLLEGPKMRAFNNVIMETEKILKYAFKVRELNPQPIPQPVPAPKTSFESQHNKQSMSRGSYIPQPQSNSMGNGGQNVASTNLLSQIDKKELASKLAAALTAQGKTDFNPEQLQQLIAVYSLIDKKKRDSAVADKQKMTLSDTLTALLNPKENNASGRGGMSGTTSSQPSGRNVGSYSRNNTDRPDALSNSSINNFVTMLNKDNLSSSGNSKAEESQMWQNLQNIQTTLRTQNTGATLNKSGGFNSSTNMGAVGRDSYRSDMSSGSTFDRGGYGTGMERGDFSLGQSGSMGFNRGRVGGGAGTGNASNGKEGSGFYGNFQSMSGGNTNFSRSGDSMADSGREFGGNNRNFTGDSNFSRDGAPSGAGRGLGSTSRYPRDANDKFLGMGSSGGNPGSGFSNNFNSGSFSSSGGFGGNKYQMGSGSGGGSGLGFGSGISSGLGMSSGGSGGLGMSGGGSSNQGGSSFRTGGSSGYGGLMSSSSSGHFNKNAGRNEIGGNQQFNSNSRGPGPNQGNNPTGRNSLGFGSGNMSMGNSSNPQNSGGNRGGSNWRNQ